MAMAKSRKLIFICDALRFMFFFLFHFFPFSSKLIDYSHLNCTKCDTKNVYFCSNTTHACEMLACSDVEQQHPEKKKHIRKSQPYIFNALVRNLKGYYAAWLHPHTHEVEQSHTCLPSVHGNSWTCELWMALYFIFWCFIFYAPAS